MATAVAEAPERLLPSIRKTEYVWKPNSRVPIRAAVAGAALEEIERRNGGLRPPEVVEASRPSESPLHGAFEWDDTIAASLHRITQAEYLLRSLVCRVAVTGREEPLETRAFVVVTNRVPESPRGDRVYVQAEEAMQRREWREEVVQRALNELRTWRDRYYSLREFSDLIPVIDTALDAAAVAEPISEGSES